MRREKKNSRSKKAPGLAIQGSFPCSEKLISRFSVNRCEDPVKDQDSKTEGEPMRSIFAREHYGTGTVGRWELLQGNHIHPPTLHLQGKKVC